MLTSLLLSAVLTFSPPIHHDVMLAGNFGEPRPNHFHAGCDVKTGQIEGKPVFSIADGYVCRVTVGKNGFGNAVYVRHPNGYTSVYCHLQRFIPQMAAMVKKWQYAHQQYVADVVLRPTDFPVAEGQLIAVSGNTGASVAPHLHLEVHDTRTWDALDPLEFIGIYVKDKTAPNVDAVMVMPVEGEGMFCGSNRKQRYALSGNMSEMTAWGKVGFAFHAEDRMEGSWNRLGIRHSALIVDGDTVFKSDMSRIPENKHRMVNSWGDFDYYTENRMWFMKSFLDKGTNIPTIFVDDNRGVVIFNEERLYHLTYSVCDYFGNKNEYCFVINGKRQDIEPRKVPAGNFMSCNIDNTLKRPDVMLTLKRGLLPRDIYINPQETANHYGISAAYTFYERLMPIFDWGEIRLKVLTNYVKHTDKFYIVCHDIYDRYIEGKYDNGWVKGYIRDLGLSYEVAYDDTPPEVKLLSETNGNLVLDVVDGKSGIASFKAYVDGEFVLFEDVPKSTNKRCILNETPIKRKGSERTLTICATDNCSNTIKEIWKILW
ncbi:M23 family metallopeptidase [Prevotella sp. OH937_COT-195]|uniref:M23 family metallopeptidase n=1 Tax=Prevotella sp. OH937_COT-195 TaxID=2491051 RepID=UPI000F652E59|nr:M23 family metallopeptidase [Prevotella sp. OH937_COT-195]RRD00850.1 M23 family metallopeptidase [Prevotella sp. OH937_COT-195]